jgi:hypothetical protein
MRLLRKPFSGLPKQKQRFRPTMAIDEKRHFFIL